MRRSTLSVAVYLRPFPARQGHRPDRRGGVPGAHQGLHRAAGHEGAAGAAGGAEQGDRGSRGSRGLRAGGAACATRRRSFRMPWPRSAAEWEQALQQQGRNRRRRTRSRPIVSAVDGRARGKDDRGRGPAADPSGGDAAQARDRSGRGRQVRGPGGSPGARGAEGSPSAHRLVHLPWPHRRGQDRAVQGAGRGAVRRREQPDPHRHVRVYGKALRLAHDRLAAGLRGPRGGRPADRAACAASPMP